MKSFVLVLALSLATACGGGGDATQKAAKATYIKHAEEICAKAVADRKALKAPLSVPEFAPFVAKVVAIADKAATQLLALTEPAKDKKDLDAKVIGPLREQVARGHAYAAQVAAASRANDQAALTRLLGNPPTDTKADLRWMKRYGFSSCVDAADTSG